MGIRRRSARRSPADAYPYSTVQQLLAVDRIRFRYLRNVGDKIRREIRLKAKHLAEYRPDLQADGGRTAVPPTTWGSRVPLPGQLPATSRKHLRCHVVSLRQRSTRRETAGTARTN